MANLTEAELNGIMMRRAGIRLERVESSGPEKISALKEESETQPLVESEEDRLMRISKRIAGISDD